MKNIFDNSTTLELQDRINSLNVDSQPLWGTMSVDQMFAHCNVAYDLNLTDKFPKPKGFKKFMIKLFAKKLVTGGKPYKKNIRTSPEFVISDAKQFEKEKEELITNVQKVESLGKDYFENRDSHAFGVLTSQEWSNTFYKHLDHHLKQFGV